MSKLDEMQAALAPAKKDGYTVTQTLYDSLEASLTAANERIKLVESEAIANEHIARNLENKLAAEREVSDKLEKALKDTLSHLVAAASLLSHSPKTAAPSNKMFDQMVVDYKAAAKRSRTALAEVAALRKKDRE